MNQISHFKRSFVGAFQNPVAIAFGCAALLSANAAELVRNGDFSAGLASWRISSRVGDYNPQPNPGVSLTPQPYNYKGVLIYQNLNVQGVSGKTLNLSLTLACTYTYDGKPLAVQLDYAVADGQVKRLTAWNPDSTAIVEGANQYTASVVMPAEAVRLVRLVVSRTAENGDYSLHRISLDRTGLTPGIVPALGAISPSTGAYYSPTNHGEVVLRGSNFGTVTGQVFVGTSPADLVGEVPGAPLAVPDIQSWNSTQIVMRVVEPMSSGQVYIMAGSVEADGNSLFSVTSPHFVLIAEQAETVALRGQKFYLPFRLDFMNGFVSQGGVSMMLTMPVPSAPETPRLVRSGGFAVELDTTALPVGRNAGMAQTLEDHSYARFASFVVDVRTTSDILFTTNSGESTVTAIKVARQGEFTSDFGYRLIDNTGANFQEWHLTATPPAVKAATDNPNVVQVFDDNFGQRFFAKDNGTAHLIFTSADGVSRTLTVQVELPATPRITTASINPGVADNSGKSTNYIYWQGTEPFGWIGYEGIASFSMDGQVWDSANKSASWTVPVPEGTPPGRYLFHAQAGSPEIATSYVMLDVVNASTHGQIEGNVVTVGGMEPYGHGAMGNLEWYDAATGEVRGTNTINAFGTSHYLASYIPPGSYKVRWVSFGYSNTSQWYPKAASFSEATAVQVTAGNTVSNVNFVLLSDPVVSYDLNIPAPAFNGSEITFAVTTESGLTYVLEYKDTLQDETWKIAQSLSGNGSKMVLADPSGPATRRFYRVAVVRPN
jgi:hypothetical protein